MGKRNITNIALSVLLLLTATIMITSSGCNNNSKQTASLRTGAVFFDDPENILWRHKVNSIEELAKYSEIFSGIEFDVVYYPERNIFEVEHDPDPNTEIIMDDYFGSIENPQKLYYWIDIKNLKYEHIDKIIERLLYVFDKHNIKDRVICESWNVNSLKALHNAGIYTSYWVPDFRLQDQITDEQQKQLDKVFNVLDGCKHNAISAPYTALPFIEKHLSDCTVHLWTNGLITEEEKSLVKEITKSDCVKVVLIDYEEPF